MSFKLDEHTGVLIKKAARLFERVANMNLNELNVTYAQTIFLVRLWEKDGQTQMELTKSAGLAQPTVVRILDRMERDKLVTRVKSKIDKRSSHFYLTKKAQLACSRLESQGELMQTIATKKMQKNVVKDLNENLLCIINNLVLFLENEETN